MLYGSPLAINVKSISGTEVGTLSAPLRFDPVGTTAQPIILIEDIWLPYSKTDLSTTVTTVKSSAGSVGAYSLYNPSIAITFIQFFDISGTVTLGTTVPVWTLAIPTLATLNLSIPFGGITFANAIKIAATTTALGLTAPATALIVNLIYK